MNLPSFVWLWRIAAWAMGLTLLVYGIQLVTGLLFRSLVQPSRVQSSQGLVSQVPVGTPQPLPGQSSEDRAGLAGQLRSIHGFTGWILVSLVLLLLTIGIVGTLGHFGSLGHSVHLWAGLGVVALVVASAGSSLLIHRRPWARSLHLSLNVLLLIALAGVSWSGWEVVQKYLP